MPADHFAPFFAGEAHINLRFLHYPPQDIADDEQFGQGPHTDNSFITILARMDVPGLAVRLPSGEWLAPPLIPGTFLVNLGNMMKRWSNDRFLSTPHAVLNESGTDRYSIAFFYSPTPSAVIECLPSCTAPDDPPHYPPAVYGDLVVDFYRANYFHQKGHQHADRPDVIETPGANYSSDSFFLAIFGTFSAPETAGGQDATTGCHSSAWRSAGTRADAIEHSGAAGIPRTRRVSARDPDRFPLERYAVRPLYGSARAQGFGTESKPESGTHR